MTTTVEAAFQVRRTSHGNLAGLAFTVLLHGALVVGIWYAHKKSREQPLQIPRDFVVAEMVKLGKPREKFWLPRKVVAPVPKAPPAEIKVTEDPNASPAPEEAPRPDDPQLSKEMKRALDRAKMLASAAAEEPDEGSLTGSPEGTSNVEKAGDQYLAKVTAAIKKNWNVPAQLVPEDELRKLEAEVKLKIDAEGKVSDVALAKPSGNQYFDDACVAAVEATPQVPPPPAEVAQRFAAGMLIVFEGKRLGR